MSGKRGPGVSAATRHEHREVLEAIRRQLSETRRLHRKELEANRSVLALVERLLRAGPFPKSL